MNRIGAAGNGYVAPQPPSTKTNQSGAKRRKQPVTLEGEPQTELDLSGRTKRVDTCSHTNAIYIVPSASGAVDLPGSSGQRSSRALPGKSKLAKLNTL